MRAVIIDRFIDLRHATTTHTLTSEAPPFAVQPGACTEHDNLNHRMTLNDSCHLTLDMDIIFL